MLFVGWVKMSKLLKWLLLFNLVNSPLFSQAISIEKHKEKKIEKQTQTFSLEQYVKEKKKYLEEIVVVDNKEYLVKFTKPLSEEKNYVVYKGKEKIKDIKTAQKALLTAL